MKKLLLAVGGALLSLSFQAQASTVACDNCSAAQMGAVAYERSAHIAQYGPLYVVDLRNGVVRKYGYFTNWHAGMDPEVDQFLDWIDEMPVEQHIAQGVAEVGGHMRAASSTEYVHVGDNPPSWMPTDVFDAMTQSHFSDDITYWINTHSSADEWSAAAAKLGTIGGGWFDPSGLAVTVILGWRDGSKATYKWDHNQQAWIRVENTARDGNGNLIPEARAQVAAQEYVFPNAGEGGSTEGADNFYDMWQYLTRLGVPVRDARTGPGVGFAITCTADICHVYIIPY
jgi:hypothetical protein